jgi:hypothetical protein
MGWTSFPMHRPVKEWFKDEWSGDIYEVIDSALVKRNTLYGAVKKKDTGEIFCAIFLIRWSRNYYNFCYKDMTEHSGSYQYDCPKKIMKLLTPLNDENDPNGWAREWRKKVEEYWNKRDILKKNKDKIIKTKEPVNFTNGCDYQYFRKVGRKIFAGVLDQNGFFEMYSRVRFNLSHYDYEFIS